MGRSPTRIDFHRTKYGREILIDVAWIRDMPTFLHAEPHWLSFYDITLITAGRGDFWLDGQRHAVRPGVVLFTSPGQVRLWRVTGLKGICLFFPSTFLEEFFNDAQFLHRLPYFHAPADAAAITFATANRAGLLRRWDRMHDELRHWSRDSVHALRASLYDELIRLAREYAHDLAEYTRALGVSSQHLSRLGFADPSYFARFFRRRTGIAPSEFRRASGNPSRVDVV